METLSDLTPYPTPTQSPPHIPTATSHHPSPTHPNPQCRIYASVNWVSIGSGNGLSPVRRLAVTWINVDIVPELDKFQWNSNRSTKLFIHENTFENVVYEMGAILSSGRWVKGPQKPVIGRFASQRASNAELRWRMLKTCLRVPLNRDALLRMQRHCNQQINCNLIMDK